MFSDLFQPVWSEYGQVTLPVRKRQCQAGSGHQHLLISFSCNHHRFHLVQDPHHRKRLVSKPGELRKAKLTCIYLSHIDQLYTCIHRQIQNSVMDVWYNRAQLQSHVTVASSC